MAIIKGVWEWNDALDISTFPGDVNEVFDMAFTIDNTACYGISLSGRNDALAFHHANGKTDFYLEGFALLDDYRYFTLDGEQDIDDDFYNWIFENAKQNLQPSAFITYNGKTVQSVMIGESITLHTKGVMMEDDIKIAVVMPTEEPGLYDAAGNTVASWSRLTKDYGMNVERDYIGDALNDKERPANVLASRSELSTGTKLVIPGTVWQIGQNAFAGVNNLTDVVILYGASRINLYAFFSCKNLKNVTVPGSVAEIGIEAFSGCPITSIKLPKGLQKIGGKAFCGCKVVSVTLPQSLTYYGDGAFSYCTNLQSIIVEEGNEHYKSKSFVGDDGAEHRVLMDKSATKIVQFPGGYNGTFDIPYILADFRDIKSIGAYAFAGSVCGEVTLPDSLERIDDFAFEGSIYLNVLEIPRYVAYIGSAAFMGCSALCGKDNEELGQALLSVGEGLRWIGDRAFVGCTALLNIRFEDGVPKLGGDLLLGCANLISISIPDTVVEIGKCIIDVVNDGLQVIFRGTQEMWEQVVVGAENANWLDKLVFWD
jgi:hypothetical protein